MLCPRVQCYGRDRGSALDKVALMAMHAYSPSLRKGCVLFILVKVVISNREMKSPPRSMKMSLTDNIVYYEFFKF